MKDQQIYFIEYYQDKKCKRLKRNYCAFSDDNYTVSIKKSLMNDDFVYISAYMDEFNFIDWSFNATQMCREQIHQRLDILTNRIFL